MCTTKHKVTQCQLSRRYILKNKCLRCYIRKYLHGELPSNPCTTWLLSVKTRLPRIKTCMAVVLVLTLKWKPMLLGMSSWACQILVVVSWLPVRNLILHCLISLKVLRARQFDWKCAKYFSGDFLWGLQQQFSAVAATPLDSPCLRLWRPCRCSRIDWHADHDIHMLIVWTCISSCPWDAVWTTNRFCMQIRKCQHENSWLCRLNKAHHLH